MKYVIVFLLLVPQLLLAQTFDAPEFELLVPEKGVVIGGVYTDSNQPLLIKGMSEVSALPLQDYLDFNMPDQASITAISFNETDDAAPVLFLVLDTATAGYQKGEVIACQNGACESRFNPYDALGISERVGIDALSSVDRFSIHLSFDTGFEFDGDYIDPRNIYSVANFGGGVFGLSTQAEGEGFGIESFNNLQAFDFNRDADVSSRFFGGQSWFESAQAGLIATNQLLGFVNGSTGFFGFLYELPIGTPAIQAYSSINSGLVGFENASMQVSEAVGVANIPLTRIQGAESRVRVTAAAFNGTAINKTDYDFTNEQVSWAHDESGQQILQVPIINNQSIDGSRTFTLEVFDGVAWSSVDASRSTMTITILDDESSDLIFKDGFE